MNGTFARVIHKGKGLLNADGRRYRCQVRRQRRVSPMDFQYVPLLTFSIPILLLLLSGRRNIYLLLPLKKSYPLKKLSYSIPRLFSSRSNKTFFPFYLLPRDQAKLVRMCVGKEAKFVKRYFLRRRWMRFCIRP